MKYTTVVADPPWPYENPGEFTKGKTPIARGAGAHARYDLLGIKDLMEMQVEPLAADDAHLYLWATNAFVPAAFDLAERWGFRPITVCTWIKTTEVPVTRLCESCREVGCVEHGEKVCKDCEWPPKDPLPVGVVRASPAAGYYFRGATEHCLFGVRGSLKLQTKEALPTAWLWPRIGKHSVKPEAFYDFVEHVSPGPYLELFARRNRIGWDTWGDEALRHTEVVMGEGDDNVISLGR